MSSPLRAIPIRTSNGKHSLTPQEQAFISSYVICKNLSQAVKEAGYKSKAPSKYGSALLDREYIREEIQYRLQTLEDAKVAKPAEILQFYTSVMRGEVLDQFGIEASLDTRIKAANELAKQVIEIPMKLEQKNITNNIGSITLNFMPRNEEIVDSEE
jgi:phage terminase small subunit